MTVSIASWYVASLLRASVHIGSLLAMVFSAAALVGRAVHIALLTFFTATGATRFLLA